MNRRYQNFRKKIRGQRASMRGKIAISLGAIAVVLLLSSTISVLEYRRMSNYVTDLISANVKCINVTQSLAKMCEEHNLKVLNAIGVDTLRVYGSEGYGYEVGAVSSAGLCVDEDVLDGYGPDVYAPDAYANDSDLLPQFDEKFFLAQCDTIRATLATVDAAALVDSVKTTYYAYKATSSQLHGVITHDFANARAWYFSTLEPDYNRLRTDISDLANAAYIQLQINSETFQASFYRSIIPGMVAAAVGLLLVLLLLFFLTVYYVNPIYRMLTNLKNSILSGTKYRYTFEGNDQLSELNDNISEIVEENVDLRRRVRILSEENEGLKDAVRSAEE